MARRAARSPYARRTHVGEDGAGEHRSPTHAGIRSGDEPLSTERSDSGDPPAVALILEDEIATQGRSSQAHRPTPPNRPPVARARSPHEHPPRRALVLRFFA